MTLEELVNELIAEAFAAGVEWHTARMDRIDAARSGLPLPPWDSTHSYEAMLKRQQLHSLRRLSQVLCKSKATTFKQQPDAPASSPKG